jgi:hypothetical protein
MTKPQIEEKEKIIEIEANPIIGEISNSPEDDISEIKPEDIENMIPQMNVSVPETPKDVQQLITDEQYLEILSDIVTNIKEDRKQVSDYIDNFADMVMNDGDATTSSKEALVNLVKIKTDMQDKMLKAADLMTRLKIKNTYAYSGPHLNAMQQNNFNIGSDANFDRKELIKAINQAKKKKKE